MFLTTTTDLTIGQAGLYAGLGYAVVFLGLILLMLVVILTGKFFVVGQKKSEVKEVPVTTPEKPVVPAAPGSAGQLKLHNVEPKTAAMLMAIVADKMGKPINELRFLSIKEVEK